MTTTPLQYLMRELGFKSSEWMNLSEADKEQLKQWAVEEMKVRGIE